MTRTSEISREEYDRLAKITCPKSRGACPAWMKGDIRRPLKRMAPGKAAAMKVQRADRSVYDACARAMLAGRLHSWQVPPMSSAWLVKVSAGEEWRELMRHEVAALLEELGCDVDVPAASKVSGPAVSPAPAAVATVPAVGPVVTSPASPAVDSVPAANGPDNEEVTAMTKVTFEAGATVLPVKVRDYVDRLVYEPKREFAAALAASLVSGSPAPDDPGTEWAGKVRTKLARLVSA